MKVRVERRFRFSASHLYRRHDWSEEENRARFGKCANLPGHGHNYRLYVTVEGEVDPATGFIIDLGYLDDFVGTRVVDRLDHQHLNSALPQFGEGGKIPSSENLILWILAQLQDLPVVKLRLEEDEDLAAEWLAG